MKALSQTFLIMNPLFAIDPNILDGEAKINSCYSLLDRVIGFLIKYWVKKKLKTDFPQSQEQ